MNLETLKLNPNWVLLKIDNSNELIKLKNGVTLFLDTSFEPEKNAQTVGTVVRTAPLFYSRKSRSHSNPWKVPMELKEGDIVIFHFMSAAAAFNEGRCFVENGEKYIIVNYDRLFVAMRSEEVIPLNGIILIEPETTGVTSSLIYIPEEFQQTSQTTGHVRYAGALVGDYIDYPDMSDQDDIKPGDKVTFSEVNSIPLQYEFHSLLKKKLYRMHRMDLLCKINF